MRRWPSRILRGQRPRVTARAANRQPRLVTQRRSRDREQGARTAADNRALREATYCRRAVRHFRVISPGTSMSIAVGDVFSSDRFPAQARVSRRRAPGAEPLARRNRWSLMPCFPATSAIGRWSASRRMVTICSSLNRASWPSFPRGRHFSCFSWSKNATRLAIGIQLPSFPIVCFSRNGFQFANVSSIN